MRTACLFDVHGNRHALDAVLAEIELLRVDAIAVGGDLALFGPAPAGCVDRLRARGDAVFVQGNTDRYLAEGTDMPVVRWTAMELGPERVAWLGSLPTRQVLAAHDALVVHATPRGDEEVLRPDTPEAEVVEMLVDADRPLVLCGHVHLQYRRQVGHWTVVNPGSVGLPFDGDRRAAWALLDGEDVELRRTSYDVDGAIEAMQRSDNPARELVLRRLREAQA